MMDQEELFRVLQPFLHQGVFTERQIKKQCKKDGQFEELLREGYIVKVKEDDYGTSYITTAKSDALWP